MNSPKMRKDSDSDALSESYYLSFEFMDDEINLADYNLQSEHPMKTFRK